MWGKCQAIKRNYIANLFIIIIITIIIINPLLIVELMCSYTLQTHEYTFLRKLYLVTNTRKCPFRLYCWCICLLFISHHHLKKKNVYLFLKSPVIFFIGRPPAFPIRPPLKYWHNKNLDSLSLSTLFFFFSNQKRINRVKNQSSDNFFSCIFSIVRLRTC